MYTLCYDECPVVTGERELIGVYGYHGIGAVRIQRKVGDSRLISAVERGNHRRIQLSLSIQLSL
jgi:hypothetical protein